MATIAALFTEGVRRFRQPHWAPGQWLEFSWVNEDDIPKPMHGPWLMLRVPGDPSDETMLPVYRCAGDDYEAMEG